MLLVSTSLTTFSGSQAQAEWDGSAGVSFGPSRPFGPEEEAAFHQAEVYWGAQPVLCTSLTKEVVATEALNGPDTPLPVAGRATQPEYSTRCGIWIEEKLGAVLCSVMRHEYGHLLGYAHEDPEMAQLPSCDPESNEPSGGIYIPPDKNVTARRQAWELFREWQAECRDKKIGSKARRRCFSATRHYAARLRRI